MCVCQECDYRLHWKPKPKEKDKQEQEYHICNLYIHMTNAHKIPSEAISD
jgi:hypothetical protein